MQPRDQAGSYPTLRQVIVFALLAGVALGALARWWQASDHFGHVDDLAVATTLLSPNRATYPTWAEVHDRADKWLRKQPDRVGASNNSMVEALVAAAIFVKASYLALSPIASNWTYAPAQFVLTDLLLSLQSDYVSAKFLGRFPSLLLGLFAIVLTYLAFSPAKSIKPSPANTIPTLLVALSWQQIIYSAQMENYAAATFGGMVLVYLVMRLDAAAQAFFEHRILLGSFLGGLTALQYQLAILVFAFLVTMVVSMKRRYPSWNAALSTQIPTVIAAGAVFSVVTLPYLFFMWKGSLNWNVGPSQEFLYQLAGRDFSSAVGYTISFFSRNLFIVVESMFAPVSNENALLPILTAALCIVILIGAASLYLRSSPETRALRYFVGTSFAVWLALVVVGKLALSPTRHTMVFVPLLLVFVAMGCSSIYDWLSRRSHKIADAAAACFCLVWIAAFAADYQTEATAREDKFSEDMVLRLVDEFQVDSAVQHTWTLSLSLMPGLRHRVLVVSAGRTQELCDETLGNNKFGFSDDGLMGRHRVMFISHWAPLPEAILPCFVKRLAGNGPNKVSLSKHLIHRVVERSDTSIDWSKRTRNGTNGLFVDIYDFSPINGAG